MARRRRLGRRVRRNPPVQARRTTRRRTVRRTVARSAARTSSISPALRAKISRGVKLANARRRSGGGIARRVFSSSPARRSASRRSSGGLMRMGGGNPLTKIFSKEILMTGGGAVAASLATGYLLANYGSKLPLATQTYGPLIYHLAIPTAGYMLTRKKAPAFANGLLIGGIVMAVNDIMKMTGTTGFSAAPTKGRGPIVQDANGRLFQLNSYPDASRAKVGNFSVAGELGRTKTFGVPIDNQPPVFTDPWSV